MEIPKKPFSSYKWRWAVLTPTEGLNEPTVYHGVLRVLSANEGSPPNSRRVMDQLGVVQQETGSNVKLTRTPERNLIRNSGQYWKALDLLGDLTGEISLTDFGRRVASGAITKTEFVMTIIKTLELPNRRIESDTTEWDDIGLRIKPLQLITDILTQLQHEQGEEHSYITPDELVRIVIPLAGVNTPVEKHTEAITLFRQGRLNIDGWPNCAPEANDRRMAREFLLFLSYYGICDKTIDNTSGQERYSFNHSMNAVIDDFRKLDLEEEPASAVRIIRETNLPSITERERVLAEVLSRPYQQKFRNNVLAAYNSTCLITGVSLESVLVADHIIPVQYEGNDLIENGLCLRADIHVLYHSGHLRINRGGSLHLSEIAAKKHNYGDLPRQVDIPGFVNLNNIDWRWKYC